VIPVAREMNTPKVVFDIGTNSVKMLLARVQDGGMLVLADELRICALGSGLGQSGRLSEEAMERSLDALDELVRIARKAGAVEFVAVGTEALRVAANSREFVERLRLRTDLDLRVIPGEEEARLSFLAAESSLGPISGELLTFDVGGGSTEFNFGTDGRVHESFSLPIGCIPATEKYLTGDPPPRERLEALSNFLDGALSAIPRKDGTLVGIGGTVTTLGSVFLGMDRFDGERIRGLVISIGEVENQVERYRSLPLEKRRNIMGLHPERAPVILAGASIVLAVMRRSAASELHLSNLSLRHGLFQDNWLS
jgi:exopolyphosphatase / guanosine-5'-triphosphate,3'-diphosphate pyrophosphatase